MSAPIIDATHDPSLDSWVPGAANHPVFPIQNLPFAIFSTDGHSARAGVAIGDQILDLHACVEARLLPQDVAAPVSVDTLNHLFSLPSHLRRALRHRLSELLSATRYQRSLHNSLVSQSACTLHLPVKIGDYTDFYAGIHHAQNVGRLFRPDSPLLPNYKHVPIGYHGRASTVLPSGIPVVRPKGQTKTETEIGPRFGPSSRLDYELELGMWMGPSNELGEIIDIEHAAEHIVGYCLLNDWSARDIQAWEYQPLGPLLSKSFHTTVSPWVITAEALAPFMIPQAKRAAEDPRPLSYLWSDTDQLHGALSITLEVFLQSTKMRELKLPAIRLSVAKASELYWTPAQMVTHHASNGCRLNPGDLLGSGTISSADSTGYGSLLEITRGGRELIRLPSDETRTFLEDGDEITMRGQAKRIGYTPIGFGACAARVISGHG